LPTACVNLREHFNTDVALYNGGGIRGDYMLPAGPITSMDVETILPFGNKAVVVNIPGAMLRQALEHSVAQLPQPWGGFLQVSGLRMRVDPRTLPHKIPGTLPATSSENRITSVEIQGRDGAYHPLDSGTLYRIVTNSFLAGGGNGYYHFKNAQTEQPTRMLIRTIIMGRLAAQPQHRFTTDDRITMQASPDKH